jgi:signal transduction histidine kinase
VFLPLYDNEGKGKYNVAGKGMVNRHNANTTNTDDGDDGEKTESTPTKDAYQQQLQNQNDYGKTNENIQNNSNNSNSNSNSNSNGHRHLYVDCDSQKVAQVVFNLLDNAMKFTFEGKIMVSTSIVTCPSQRLADGDPTNNPKGNKSNEGKNPLGDDTESNRCVLVVVEDTGVGINSQIKNQLFEKFATKSQQGTGLGLYLSKKIIESHGGNIWHEESSYSHGKGNDGVMGLANGKTTGTTFKFAIPIAISKKNKSLESLQ